MVVPHSELHASSTTSCPAAVTLFDRLQHQRQNYGNPTFTPLKEPFDVTWGAGDTKIALRWTWLDSSHIRKSHTDSDSLLACTLVWNHKEHLLLKEEDNPCLYVNARLRDYPGKTDPNLIPTKL
jgi:hypothetical protein